MLETFYSFDEDEHPNFEQEYPEIWQEFMDSALDRRFKNFAEAKQRVADLLVPHFRAVGVTQFEALQASLSDLMAGLRYEYEVGVEDRIGGTHLTTLDEDKDKLYTAMVHINRSSANMQRDSDEFHRKANDLRRRLPQIGKDTRDLWDMRLGPLDEQN